MPRYKSTLATTALAALGLLGAAQILHPGNFEPSTRLPSPVVASAQAAGGAGLWSDPPARPRGESAALAHEPDAAPSATTRAPAPQAPEIPAAQPARTGAAPRGERARRAVVSERRKLAQRAVRARQAALGAGMPAQPAVAPDARAPERIDPIGDLIRGLGIGRDREG